MPRLFLPDSLADDLENLLDCEQRVLEALAELLDTDEGVGSAYSVAGVLSDRTGVPTYRGYQAVEVVRFLGRQKRDYELSDDAVVAQLKQSFSGLAEKIEARRSVLLRLLTDKPSADIARKRKRLMRGAVNTLVSIRGYCDIRPLFDLERTRVLDRVPVVLTRFDVENELGEEETLVIQLNEESLKLLEEFLAITKKKLQLAVEHWDLRLAGEERANRD